MWAAVTNSSHSIRARARKGLMQTLLLQTLQRVRGGWRARAIALLAPVVVALLGGCGEDPVAPFDPSRDGKLRVVHASSASQGPADFLLEGARIAQLGYGQTTEYITVTGGTHT